MGEPAENLIERALAGDEKARVDLVRVSLPTIKKVVAKYRLTPADSDDVSQEILIRLLKVLPQFKGESKFSTWLWRVAANEILMRRRSHQRRAGREISGETGENVLSFTPDNALVPDDALDAAIDEHTERRAASAMLESLSPEEREVFVRYHTSDASGVEIARALGVTDSALKSRVFRIRRRLQGMVGNMESLATAEDRIDEIVPRPPMPPEPRMTLVQPVEPIAFHTALTQARVARSMTQKTLADLVERSPAVIWFAENNRGLSMDTYERILDLFPELRAPHIIQPNCKPPRKSKTPKAPRTPRSRKNESEPSPEVITEPSPAENDVEPAPALSSRSLDLSTKRREKIDDLIARTSAKLAVLQALEDHPEVDALSILRECYDQLQIT